MVTQIFILTNIIFFFFFEKNIIIATGSKPNGLPEKQNLTIDEKYVCSSTGALEQTKIPKRLTIYGGGIVGLEIVSVY